jgi:hypothetical protein
VLVLVELVPDALVVDPAELFLLSDLLGGLDEPLQQRLDVLDGERVDVEVTSSLSFLLTL